MLDLYCLQIVWTTGGDKNEPVLQEIPYTAESDQQAVHDALTHADNFCESMDVEITSMRVSAISVGPIGSHGNPYVIEALHNRLIYQHNSKGPKYGNR